MAVSPLEERYATEMNAVFEEEAKLRYWLRVEAALARAHARAGNIPADAAERIAEAAKKVRLQRVKQIERETHHDLMAVVKALTEQSGTAGRFVHLGATSYDIEDTATALMLRDAVAIIEKNADAVGRVLLELARKHKRTVCVGRTHGQHAVPTTYGMKFALYASEMQRNAERLREATKRLLIGKMSGAVGTAATLGEKAFEIQRSVMQELGLEHAAVANQVVQRDRHAEALFVLALYAATLEKIAKEIRNLQRTEIAELAEPFASAQVGSSTMPQKRNPHRSERVCGIARVVRANVQTGLENVALEHERDLTNSASERIVLPESFILTDYMLKEMRFILSGIEFFPANIKRNLELTQGAILAERVMIALAERGMGRQQAHELLRKASIEAAKKQKSLKAVLNGNARVKKLLGAKELDSLFDYSTYIGKAVEIVDDVVRAL
jgi:adenylosuccinate lyase